MGAVLFDETVDGGLSGPFVAVLQEQQGREYARQYSFPFPKGVYGYKFVGKSRYDNELVPVVLGKFPVCPFY